MQFKRIVPVLTIIDDELQKTIRFENPRYVGDPINAVKIFNEKLVDEILIADIRASRQQKSPNFELIKDIVSEAFMPVCYAGGVTSLDDFKQIIKAGVEKVGIATHLNNRQLIKDCVGFAGSSSVVACLNVIEKDNEYQVITWKDEHTTTASLLSVIQQVEEDSVGEIMINHLDRDGTYLGYDENLIALITKNTKTPIIFCGGAAAVKDIKMAFDYGIEAAAVGSMFMFYGKLKAVLINYLMPAELAQLKDHLPQ
jgi:cyclase